VGGRRLTGGRTDLHTRRQRAHQPGHRQMGTRGAARGLAGHASRVGVPPGRALLAVLLGFVLTSAGFATGQP
jgi:hypothetical protein